MKFETFIGESYTARSLSISAQRSLNLYLEAEESHDEEKAQRSLVGTPGIALFSTLPTTPVRGIWTGLIDNLPGSSGTDLCYVAAGAKLYQVFAGGGYSLIGDIGDDAGHSPVTFNVNGGQIFITSAGLGWIYGQNGLAQAHFNNGQGTVSIAGTTVTWISGDQFDQSIVGSGFIVSGTAHLIASYTDETHIELVTAPGTYANVAYMITAEGGTCHWSGFTLTWVSGDDFSGLAPGDPMVLQGGTSTLVDTVISNIQITILAGTGTPEFDLTFQHAGPVKAAMGAFLDTYFIALPPGSKTFNISANNDGTSWNPADYARKSAFPDNVAAVLADHEELWLFGSETTEIWSNTGNADFPLQRNPGAFIHQGIHAPFTCASLANGVVWLGGDTRGTPIAWRAEGFTPVRISTHAIEATWGKYATTNDATAYVYVEDGHQFWVLTFPSADATWVYDATAGAWHERSWWDGSADHRQRQWCHGFCFGKHLVGDWQNGKIYQQSLDLYSDLGSVRHYVRSAPHETNEENWSFFSRFRLSMASGPIPRLQWSLDLGETFNTLKNSLPRQIGSATQWNEWRRLGRSRDRVWSVDILENSYQVALNAAYIDAKDGNG